MIYLCIGNDIGNLDKEHAKYVFKTFFSISGIPYKFCDKPNSASSVILYYAQDVGVFRESMSAVYIPHNPNTKKILNPKIKEKNNLFMISDDIISSAFFFLSREEEIYSKKDEFGCYPAKNSIIYPKLHIPVVNEYFKLLLNAIKKCLVKQDLPLIQKCYWPDGKKFAVCLTHDIDRIGKWPMSQILYNFLECVKYHKLNQISKIFRVTDSIREIMRIEEEYGFKSSFYFRTDNKNRSIALIEYILSKIIPIRQFSSGYAPGYDIRNKKIVNLIKEIDKNGFEIGLHGSFNSPTNIKELKSEKNILEEILGEEVNGVRQHFLRFEIPKTWDIQEKCGFGYDSTLGYNEAVGFRAGVCFPYQPYQKKLLEIPLMVMDITLFEWLNYAKEGAWIVTKNLIDTIERYEGMITLSWHNNSFEDEDKTEIYKRCLEYLKSRDTWFATAREISEWIEKRDSLKFIDFNMTHNKLVYTFQSTDAINGLLFKIENANISSLSIDGVDNFQITEEKDDTSIAFDKISPKKNIFITINLKR